MPIATPFHPRTSSLCTSLFWKEWAGHYAVRSYDVTHDAEYFALRHAAGLIDVSPLFKYDIRGRDAARFLARVTTRDVTKLKPGRVTYLCWCDDNGKVVDDGTVARITDDHWRLTAAEPSLAWFDRFSRGYDVEIVDTSVSIAALSLQGPKARAILVACAGEEVEALKFFAVTNACVAGRHVLVSRTGYTGDLGYEIWCQSSDALAIYDAVMAAGAAFGLLPVGLDAMDVARIEAGFVMNGVDYFSAHHCLIEERKSSPFELGLGWTVELERLNGEPFVGQAALKREMSQGSEWSFVGLDVDWLETEALFASYGLPPEVCSKAWRDGRPVYDQAGYWIGMATSGAWSPILKKNLALAQVQAPFAKPGTKLKIEVTAEYRRHAVTATVCKPPFFNPPRKKS